MQPDSRFYLQPLKKLRPDSEVWFTKQPLGQNSIGNIGKNMAVRCSLSSDKKTNHSARKTAIAALLHDNIAPTSVIQLTGHKNIQSLNSYSTLSYNQQEDISRALSNHVAAFSGQPDLGNNMPTDKCEDYETIAISPGL
jgi:hypothetical protein